MKITILLTTTVNIQSHISWLKQIDSIERKNMYENIISLWLEKTELNIVVVENSGYAFENLQEKYKHFSNRFEIICFDYGSIPKNDKQLLDNYEAKGQHEVYAINYASKKSKIIQNSDYLIKITGRYFIPSFEKMIKNNLQDLKYQCIRQSTIWRKMNRCEIVGCSIKYINNIFEFPSNDDMLELEYMNRMNKLKNILTLPKMKLHQKTKQGVGKLMTYL